MSKDNMVRIMVVGIGGAGGNTLNDMSLEDISNIEFVAMNTDLQDLNKSKATIKVQLGKKITKGLGAGANPEFGRLSAEEDKEKIKEVLSSSDLIFITAGMGGGTGTGAAPIVAKIAKDLGILTVAVVTKPFSFEGAKRQRNSLEGIEGLMNLVDTLIIIPNDRLFDLPNKNISLMNAFQEANNILKIGMKGIADLITNQGYINLDFSDVKTIMSNSGTAMLGFGYSEGEDRARRATELALSNPLLERPLSGAKRVLLNITGGEDLSLSEASEIAGLVAKAIGETDTEIIFGTVLDSTMKNSIKVTIIATDFNDTRRRISYDMLPTPEKSKDNVNSSINANMNINVLDIPAVLRRKR